MGIVVRYSLRMNNEVCLSWNLFEENFKESLRELREDQDYSDVTIACEGDFQVDAHKIVLSMGSRFFREIIKKSRNKNTFIFLKGINQTQLKNLMNFLYYDEAKLERDDLNEFFKISKELHIKGLESYQEESAALIDPAARDDSILEEIETPEDDLTKCDEFAFTPLALEDGSFLDNPEPNERQDDSIIKHEEIVDIDSNEETRILADSLICSICQKRSASKKALAVHVINNHSQKTFDCKNCGKSGMRKMTLKNHKRMCKDSGLSKRI